MMLKPSEWHQYCGKPLVHAPYLHLAKTCPDLLLNLRKFCTIARGQHSSSFAILIGDFKTGRVKRSCKLGCVSCVSMYVEG